MFLTSRATGYASALVKLLALVAIISISSQQARNTHKAHMTVILFSTGPFNINTLSSTFVMRVEYVIN